MYQLLPTTTTADESARGATCAILPVGSFEQHGDYLPLITDTVVASVIAQELADAYPLFRLPRSPSAAPMSTAHGPEQADVLSYRDSPRTRRRCLGLETRAARRGPGLTSQSRRASGTPTEGRSATARCSGRARRAACLW